MESAGYQVVHPLLRSGPYAMHRGRRLRDGRPVLIKTTTAAPRAVDVDALGREARLLQDLEGVDAPRPIELVHGDHVALVLEDEGLLPVRALLQGEALGLSSFFRLAIALCTTLRSVHQRGVIHGGVSPAAVFTSPAFDRAHLVDFSRAVQAAFASDARVVADAETATYAAPEQTGRINRRVDHRADLYSLGATLYELLTGTPPFASGDPLELIHAHIARVPRAPSAVNPLVPAQVSRIVLRLLAKEAADRYQTAAGLARDLERCEREWLAVRQIDMFEPGRQDVSDRFLIPQTLYGREAQMERLTGAFVRACEGAPSFVLVSGPSGAGKTSLIAELCRSALRERGTFVSGKFDQVVRETPYAALVQAIRGVIWQLLTESEERLASGRQALSAALGAGASVLAEVVPDLTFVLGRLPPAPAVEPAEAQNRLRLAFENFIGAIATGDHPLVVFLDDLQWVDAATLALVPDLLASRHAAHVLFIGAFRDNEVGPAHPLTQMIAALDRAGAPVERIPLGALDRPDVVRLVADTLHVEPGAAEPLADVLRRKTDGTPLFLIQFLNSLHQRGLVGFDEHGRRWIYHLEAVEGTESGEDVAGLLRLRIRRLAPPVQRLLTKGACLGGTFEADVLAAVAGVPAAEVEGALSEAVDAGLLSRVTLGGPAPPPRRAYAFVHDRVQQAAHSLVPEEDRGAIHLEIGRALLLRAGDSVPDEEIFALVHHYNIGRTLLRDDHERRTVARLNLQAARRARGAAAWEAASVHLDAGIGALAPPAWETHYDLLFALHLDLAECRYLTGRLAEAEAALDALLPRAATPLDAALVHMQRIVLNENLSRFQAAVDSGRAALRLLGVELPEAAGEVERQLQREIEEIERLRADRPIAALVDAPVIARADLRMVLRILTSVWAPAYLAGDHALTRLVSATLVRISLAHGHTEASAYGYVTHAITVGPVRKDYAAAYEWGQLALQVNDRLADARTRAKIHQQFHAHVNLWRRPFETCIPHAREARRSGLESGDFTYAGYGAVTESWPAFLISTDLSRFVADHTPSLALLDRIRMRDFGFALTIMLQWARALQGRTEAPTSLSGDGFDEAARAAEYERDAPVFLGFLLTARTHLLVMHERFAEARAAAASARPLVMAGTIWPVLLDFWGGLASAGASDRLTPPDRAQAAAEIARARISLDELAASCPENFRGFAVLLAAEEARAGGRPQEAAALAGESIGWAAATDNLQMLALSHELAARARHAGGDAAAAAVHRAEAVRAYSRWGAAAKVAQLEERYGPLPGGHDAATARARDAEGVATGLDLATVLKIARAIASEIELDGLLDRLMRIALENAGAERGVLLLERDGHLLVEAEAHVERDTVAIRQALPLDQSDLPIAIVRSVWRAQQPLILGDAGRDPRFASDPGVARREGASILCVPVSRQGRPCGVLYLENLLTRDVFTPERGEMMRIVAGQAAVALDNARLYEAMKQEVERRTAVQGRLREALQEVEALKNRLEAENVYLQEEIHTEHNFNEVIGRSPALLEALRLVERVAPTDSTVLIAGETGSGKELFARAVHSRSGRRARPLVKVNCGAIAPGLVESELFGHVKGAFTGAIDRRIGRFELAAGGTIFLDEVGELPLDAQVKLLRVLQEQEFEPVGSSRTVKVDVRVIAATNRDLEKAVAEGRFRADLLYRLNVFPIRVPALRERAGDVPLLVSFFVAGLSRRLGKPISNFNTRAMDRLVRYFWPGNVRELQNVVERAAILAAGPILDLEPGFGAGAAATRHEAARGRDTLDDVQRDHILSVLKSTGGVVEGARGAASILGLHPNTLRSRMKKLGIAATPRAGAS